MSREREAPPLVWRVAFEDGRTIPFYTERGARTAAAIGGRSGRAGAAVEHLDGDGWHACPGAEVIPARAPTDAERSRARLVALPRPAALAVNPLAGRRRGRSPADRR